MRVNYELFRDAAHGVLLLAQTLETNDDVAQLLAAAPLDDALVVRLEAHPKTLAERIIDREPTGSSGLPGLVEHAQELAGSMPGLAAVDLAMSTEGQRPEQVADRIGVACPVLAARSDGGTLRA